jgi:hypothetical protein
VERRPPPRWHEGNKEHVHEVYRTSRAHGGAARATTTIDPFDRTTSIHPDEVYYLGFGTDIYHMLGHLGWVQFSN